MAGRAILAVLPASSATVASAASAPRSATVLVGDATLNPATATIRQGTPVYWVSAGRKAHRVTSDTKAFPAFSIATGKRHKVTFRRSGRFPYHVDGSRKGLVLVVAGAASGGGPTGGSGSAVHWHGIMTSDTSRTYPPVAGSCTDSWETDISVIVAPNGSLSGKGTAILTAGPACTKITHIDPVKKVNVLVSGAANATTFRLKLRENGVSPPVPALLYAGFLSVFVSNITDPTSSPLLLVKKQEPCSAISNPRTSLTLPTHDVLTSENVVYMGCD